MKYVNWGQDEDTLIHCQTDLGADIVLIAQGAEAQLVERVHARWGDLCRDIGARYGVPGDWLEAMIVRESRGDENVVSSDGGVGLTQITDPSLKGTHTDEELKNPTLNLTIAAKYIATLRAKYGDDFPVVSAAFNAGSRRPGPDPWGMVATAGHVSAEVRALNFLRAMALPDDVRARVLASVDMAATDEVSDVIDPMGASSKDS